jgi:hypothetical protein
MRAGHLQDRRTQATQRRDGLLESGQDTRLVTLTAEFSYHRDPYSGEVGPGPVACCRGDGWHALWDRGRITRIVAAHHLVQQRSVEHGPAERSGLVERGRERDQSVSRHTAVRRLVPDNAGDGGGLPDRPSGIGSDAERRLEG